MNANDARELSQRNLKGPVIKPYLDKIYARIKTAAESGLFQISNPWTGHDKYPSTDIQREIKRVLIAEGYKVEYHPDPDPGHPCSHAYDTVEW